jgi:hypothetical protein
MEPTTSQVPAMEGVTLTGELNTADDRIRQNIEHSIRLGHPQVWMLPPNHHQAALVGGGPSLDSTLDELRDLVYRGTKLVTMNGAYGWAIDHGLKPDAQVVMDARVFNSRFVNPAIPGCRYYLASQCAPETWAAVDGRPLVAIFHATAPDSEYKGLLDAYYAGQWQGIAGGTTVASRAIGLFRWMGFLRFHLFGVDSCFMDGRGHAYEQPENEQDATVLVRANPKDAPEMARTFVCSPWHLKQVEDFLEFIRAVPDAFLLNVHGDGLLAFTIRSFAELSVERG